MKRRLPTISQGEVALAAISLPPLTAQANRHKPAASHPGSAHAAPNAESIAANANRPASAAGRIASPPSSTASAANATPSSRPRAANRRTHPRAVVSGTPARAAAGRTPHAPPATPAITVPIVSASATMSQGSLPPGVDYQGVLDAMYKSKEGVIADDALFDKINQELSWTPRAASVHRGFWPFRRS
jgi:hypothetical protein